VLIIYVAMTADNITTELKQLQLYVSHAVPQQ